jgi:hypothetical protein
MPDFPAFVRQHLPELALPQARERKIVEELAAQLEDAYDALRATGLSDDEAWRGWRSPNTGDRAECCEGSRPPVVSVWPAGSLAICSRASGC